MSARSSFALAATLALTAIAAVSAGPGQFADLSPDLVREPAIDYFTTPAADRVARLNADIQRGSVRLAFDPLQGYLPSILQALKVPVASQLLVYTRSSVQASRINPRNPRAIFFDDTVTLGFIPGAEFLEFAAEDPRQGVVFYTLDQRAVDRPVIERRDFCLSCHNNRSTLEVPGAASRRPRQARPCRNSATTRPITGARSRSGGPATTSPAGTERCAISATRCWWIARARHASPTIR